MKRATLTRRHAVAAGILGELVCVDGPVLYTAELPWRDNATNRSCIPPGKYTIRQRWFNRKGYLAIGIEGVPCRSNILMHRANHPSELRGCIAPGLGLDLAAERVTSSTAALDKVLAWLDGDEAELEIIDATEAR